MNTLKYRFCGVDVDGQNRQFGHSKTLKDARKVKKDFAAKGILLVIQNVETSKTYK
jgi:hypothetical protein